MPTKPPGRREPSGRGPGRPTSFTPEIGDAICARIATCKDSLKTICKADEMPSVRSVFTWLRSIPDFKAAYDTAKGEQAELLVEEMLEIADDGSNDSYRDESGNVKVDKDHIQRSRLRVETRKWLVAKLLPAKYGEKIEVSGHGLKTEVNVSVVMPEQKRMNLIERRRRVLERSTGNTGHN